MFNQIINPIDNKSYSIYSNQGKKILKNYVKLYSTNIGGSNQGSDQFFINPEDTSSILDMIQQTQQTQQTQQQQTPNITNMPLGIEDKVTTFLDDRDLQSYLLTHTGAAKKINWVKQLNKQFFGDIVEHTDSFESTKYGISIKKKDLENIEMPALCESIDDETQKTACKLYYNQDMFVDMLFTLNEVPENYSSQADNISQKLQELKKLFLSSKSIRDFKQMEYKLWFNRDSIPPKKLKLLNKVVEDKINYLLELQRQKILQQILNVVNKPFDPRYSINYNFNQYIGSPIDQRYKWIKDDYPELFKAAQKKLREMKIERLQYEINEEHAYIWVNRLQSDFRSLKNSIKDTNPTLHDQLQSRLEELKKQYNEYKIRQREEKKQENKLTAAIFLAYNGAETFNGKKGGWIEKNLWESNERISKMVQSGKYSPREDGAIWINENENATSGVGNMSNDGHWTYMYGIEQLKRVKRTGNVY